MKADTKATGLAAAYRRLFKSEDGVTVLADLTEKFGGHRPRNPELLRYIAAADATKPVPIASSTIATLIDGQASVVQEILDAIEAGRHCPDSSPTQP